MSSARAQEAIELLQQLLRIDTVNPPGNERPAQELVAGHLRAAGLEVTLLGEEPQRPNLVARLEGARRGRFSACSHTPTPWWPIPRAGVTDRGRELSPRAASGGAARST